MGITHCDIPAPPNRLDIVIDENVDNFKANLVEICRSILPSWHQATCEETEMHPIGGGITNKLFLMRNETTKAESVVIRRFGDDTEVFINRDEEASNNIQLNAYGFGAALLAILANGRVENFLSAYTLEPDDMRNQMMVPRIAQRLAEFHACNIQQPCREPRLWVTINSWLERARTLDFQDEEKRSAFSKVDFEAMKHEVCETQNLCDSTHSPVVFCHNDLLSGNMMLIGGSKEKSLLDMKDLPLQLIDFEYGCYSFRGFDWGNHFNEWAGFECEWDKFPSTEQMASFLRVYLETGSVRSISPEQIALAVVEARAFCLASHIYWGVWALLQARYSLIDFDFIGYSGRRWQRYYDTKKETRALVLQNFKPPVGESTASPFPPAFPDAPCDEVPEPPKPTVPVMHGETVSPVRVASFPSEN